MPWNPEYQGKLKYILLEDISESKNQNKTKITKKNKQEKETYINDGKYLPCFNSVQTKSSNETYHRL